MGQFYDYSTLYDLCNDKKLLLCVSEAFCQMRMFSYKVHIDVISHVLHVTSEMFLQMLLLCVRFITHFTVKSSWILSNSIHIPSVLVKG